jgi:hypothetical protein
MSILRDKEEATVNSLKVGGSLFRDNISLRGKKYKKRTP